MLLAVVFIPLGYTYAQSSTGNDLESERYLVYDAAINKMFAGNKVTFDTQSAMKQIVIRESTITDYAFWETKENWQQVKYRLPALSDETIADYESRLKNSTKLTRKFTLRPTYTLLSKGAYESVFGDDKSQNSTEIKWSEYYKKYSGSEGYIWLSNVGYNKSRDQALLYFVHWCGIMCGTGHYILLDKKNDVWIVAGIGGMWIS